MADRTYPLKIALDEYGWAETDGERRDALFKWMLEVTERLGRLENGGGKK